MSTIEPVELDDTTIEDIENQLGMMVLKDMARDYFARIVTLWGDEFGWSVEKRKQVFTKYLTEFYFTPIEIPEQDYQNLLDEFREQYPREKATRDDGEGEGEDDEDDEDDED